MNLSKSLEVLTDKTADVIVQIYCRADKPAGPAIPAPGRGFRWGVPTALGLWSYTCNPGFAPRVTRWCVPTALDSKPFHFTIILFVSLLYNKIRPFKIV